MVDLGIQPVQTATNVRAGDRFSTLNPGVLSPANTVDSKLDRGLYWASSHTGRTNLVPSDFSLWTAESDTVNTPPVVTDRGNGVWRMVFQNATGSLWGTTVKYDFPQLSGPDNGSCSFEYRVISGDTTDFAVKFASGTPGADAVVDFNDDGNWYEVESHPLAGSRSCDLQLLGPDEGGSGSAQSLTIEFRRMRLVDAPRKCPAFPDYTNAGQSYGSDRIRTGTLLGIPVGAVYCAYVPYGWGNDAVSGEIRPNTGPRMFHFASADLKCRMNGSIQNLWFMDAITNLGFQAESLDGELTVLFNTWDGTDIFAEGRPGTSDTKADAIQPSGILHLGTNNAGTREIGGEFVLSLYTAPTTATDRDSYENFVRGNTPIDPDGGIGTISPRTFGLGLGLELGLGSAYS